MKLTKGNKLPSELQEQIKRNYIYRLTIENGYPEKNPCNAKVPAIGDEQWLAEHAFYVTNNGALSKKHTHCEPHYLAD